MKTQGKYMKCTQSAGKRVWTCHEWLWFYFWLDEKFARVVIQCCKREWLSTPNWKPLYQEFLVSKRMTCSGLLLQRTPSLDRRTDEPMYSETFESPENKTTSPKKSETLRSPNRSLESGPLSPTLSEGELSQASEAGERSPTLSSTRVRIWPANLLTSKKLKLQGRFAHAYYASGQASFSRRW